MWGEWLVRTVTSTKVTSTKIRGCGIALALVVCAVAVSSEPAGAATVPVPPRSVRIAPGNGRATVRWHKPSDNGAPITQYEVGVYHNNATVGVFVFHSSATTETITGLKNGSPFTFKVAARNAAGWSKFSARSAEVRIGTPLPIGRPSVVSGKGQATVSWHAATANGAAINEYRVTPRLNGHERPAHVFKGAKTRGVVTGLQSGTKYTFEIAAHNSRGWGITSDPSSEVKIK